MTHLHTKFLVPNSSDALIVAIESKITFSCRRHFVILQLKKCRHQSGIFVKDLLPSNSVEAVTLLTCIQDVPDSNLGQDTDYSQFFFVISRSSFRRMLG
jgi:hypothetical protein